MSENMEEILKRITEDTPMENSPTSSNTEPPSRNELPGDPNCPLCGGSGYLPEHLAAEHLKAGSLYKVCDTPVIDRRVYAVYQGYGERRGFVEDALGYLRTNPQPQLAHSSSDR